MKLENGKGNAQKSKRAKTKGGQEDHNQTRQHLVKIVMLKTSSLGVRLIDLLHTPTKSRATPKQWR